MKRRLADWLCRIASWLRGEKWYVADAWHGVPGNRASELHQRIWQNCVWLKGGCDDTGSLRNIERDLDELSQAAGESWGHVWPKDRLGYKKQPRIPRPF